MELFGSNVITEADKENAFAVLRNAEILAVEDFGKDFVADLLKGAFNDFESAALIVNGQPFNVFAEDDLRFVQLANPNDILKERASAKTFVVVVETLTFSRQREGLAGETGKTNVEGLNVLLVNLGDVSGNLEIVGEVGTIGLLGVLIPFADKACFKLGAEGFLKAQTDSSDACEKIN